MMQPTIPCLVTASQFNVVLMVIGGALPVVAAIVFLLISFISKTLKQRSRHKAAIQAQQEAALNADPNAARAPTGANPQSSVPPQPGTHSAGFTSRPAPAAAPVSSGAAWPDRQIPGASIGDQSDGDDSDYEYEYEYEQEHTAPAGWPSGTVPTPPPQYPLHQPIASAQTPQPMMPPAAPAGPMLQFRIVGVDLNSSADKTIDVQAPNEAEAKAIAEQQGMWVNQIQPLGPPAGPANPTHSSPPSVNRPMGFNPWGD